MALAQSPAHQALLATAQRVLPGGSNGNVLGSSLRARQIDLNAYVTGIDASDMDDTQDQHERASRRRRRRQGVRASRRCRAKIQAHPREHRGC